MTTSRPMPSGLAVWRLLGATLIACHLWRVIGIAPDWLNGVPQRYPGQYNDRMLSAVGGITLLLAVLVSSTAFGRSARGRAVAIGLLVVSMGTLAIQIYSEVRAS